MMDKPKKKNPNEEKIFFCTQWMTAVEKSFVSNTLDSDWVTTVGPDQTAFENEFSQWMGNGLSSLSTNSGTSALELAYHLIGVGKDDIVICSTFTFIATISPAIKAGAIPIFIDSEEDSWNMDPALLEDALARLKKKGKHAKAVALAHIYGQAANVKEIKKICDKYEVPLVEDCAEAVGTTIENKHVGRHGEFAIFSFNGNKMITTGGGGMLCAKSPALIEQARHLAFQAKNSQSWDYVHNQLGFNFRLSNVLAAIGRGQVKRLPEILKQKRQIFENYHSCFKERDDLVMMVPPSTFRSKSSHWLNIVRLVAKKSRLDREMLRDFLAKKEIQTRPVWYPLHRQPVFHGAMVYSRGVADAIHSESICLPSGLSLTKASQKIVIEAVLESLDLPKTAKRPKYRTDNLIDFD